MRIAVDAMGGDHAPGEIVAGALRASELWQIPITLVGQSRAITPHLRSRDADVEVVEAPEVIGGGESPAQAVRHKRQSSIVLGARLVADGQAAAFVSAGNTGALMAASLMVLGKIMRRPALGAVMPTAARKPLLLLDAGASVDARPEDLRTYALVGSLYAEKVLGVERPRVGLLNIGSEPSKGNALVRAAYELLAKLPINFAGNVEGRELAAGEVDVVVCDGFVGNTVLKVAEGYGLGVFQLLRREIRASATATAVAALLKPRLRRVGQYLDYANYGGAPLFGVRGPVIKCHGSSKGMALSNGVRVARDYAATGTVQGMEDLMAKGADA